MQQYQILNIIGQGAFGNAYLARHFGQDKNYVIKKVELTNKNQQQRANIFNEVKLLQQFKHVNIVSYRQSIIEGQELNIIMEFCYGGDLNQLITEQKENNAGEKLTQSKIVDWAAQIALAIFYMHDKRILHRDLKTPNIFIVDDKVKLGDFGISKVLDEKIDLASTSIGTPYYMSPQQYRHKPYSYKSDMWAFGCILYEMCNQKRPFEAYSLNGLAVKVIQANFAPVSEYYSKELRDLIKSMLQKREKDRPLIHDFLKTPIIKRRTANYLRQVYQKLTQENGDKILIEGVLYQAKKLGITISDKKESESAKKAVKPEFSAQKKKQQKQRIRQQLQEQLRKLSEKDKQQKEQLRKLKQNRNLLKRGKKEVDKSQITNRKSHSNSTKSLKQQSTVASQSKRSSVHSVKSTNERQKPFEIKQKYDMYDMEYQEQDSEEEHPVEAIDEVDQQQQKPEVVSKVEEKQYDKEKYVKPTIKQSNTKNQVSKEKFTQLAPIQANPKVQTQNPIQEAISNLKESIKLNKQALNTIKNQLSNIDFQISDSQDQLQKTVQRQSELPKMKKKQKNPAHIAISDKINDLRLTLQSLLSNESIEMLIKLAQVKGQQATRVEVEKITGSLRGTYHIAKQVVKLSYLLQRIPLYV